MKRDRSVQNRLLHCAVLLLTLVLLLTPVSQVLAEDPELDAYPNTWQNTGDEAADIVGVALTQVGYQESPNDHSKYNVWYYGSDTELAWCSIFISWCADQAGVETWVMPKNNQAKSFTVNNMEDNPFGGTAWAWGNVEPQPGDILYTAPIGESVSTHTALVYQTDENMIFTVEGNTKDATGTGAVVLQSYYRADGSQREENDHILFVVRPEYHNYVPSSVQEATCMEPCVTTYVCTVCGMKKLAYGSVLADHSWDSGSLQCPVTDRKDGVVQYTCTVCGKTKEIALHAGGDLFADVQESSAWYYRAANWAYEERITTGTASFTFSPDQCCTRGQAVTMLWRAMDKPVAVATEDSFVDVTSDSAFYEAVIWAASTDVTSGVSETAFSPDTPITRAQAVTLLWRTAGSPEAASSDFSFIDVSTDAYYAQAIVWAVEQGIASGLSATTFGPDQPVTRAQLVTMLWRQAGRPALRRKGPCIAAG